MRILQVCSYLYPALTYGGPAKMVYDLSLELSKNNHVTIYTTDVWDSKRRISEIEKIKSTDRLVVKYSPNIFNSLAFRIRLFTGFKMIPDFIKNHKIFDLVHFHDIFILPQLFMALLAVIFRVPFFITPHGVLDPVRLEKKTVFKKMLMPLANFCLKKAKAIIAVSKKEATDLDKLGFKNVKIIWNGIPPLTTKSSKKFRKYYLKGVSKKEKLITLLYIGKIHPQKGLKEALLALSKSKLRAQFLIAGPNDGGKNKLMDIVNETGLKNIHFLGFVEDKEKKELYKFSDIFIHPSYAEGFSISILEAMQESLPVVISDGCNFLDFKKQKAGYLVRVSSLESDLVKVFNNISVSKKTLSQFGKNGAKLIKKKYTVSNMSSNNLSLYEKLI